MSHNPKPSINWKKTIRAGLIAALMAAVVVVNTPVQASYAVSWGGCGSNCAGKVLSVPCDLNTPACTKAQVDTNNSNVDVP